MAAVTMMTTMSTTMPTRTGEVEGLGGHVRQQFVSLSLGDNPISQGLSNRIGVDGLDR